MTRPSRGPRAVAALAAAFVFAALVGCKYIADLGPKPLVMPAYPVQNVPAHLPAPQPLQPPKPGLEPNSPVRAPTKLPPAKTTAAQPPSLR